MNQGAFHLQLLLVHVQYQLCIQESLCNLKNKLMPESTVIRIDQIEHLISPRERYDWDAFLKKMFFGIYLIFGSKFLEIKTIALKGCVFSMISGSRLQKYIDNVVDVIELAIERVFRLHKGT